MRSMTGFGHIKKEHQGAKVEISVRSVNGRFLETRFHLPREYHGLESDLRKVIASVFKRGTVDVYIHRRITHQNDQAQLTVNQSLAKKYVDSMKALSKKLKVKHAPSIQQIIQLPEIVHVELENELDNSEVDFLKKLLEEAVQSCEQEKTREGKALQKDLSQWLQKLSALIQGMSTLREEANQALQQKLDTKIKSRLQGMEVDPQRLAQEVVFQLEKSDINEELTRLDEHMKSYQKLIQSSEAEGKKLDFYTQELLREVNTIGSKSQLAKLTQAVVEAKTIIEKLREQVQNVE